jgi:tetratricopeptide (TPR) repeat protein
MESYAAPIRALAEEFKWFVRAKEVRCFHITTETDLRKAVVTMAAAQEMHPENRAPFFLLEDAFVSEDDGWSLRVDRVRAHHGERQKAFAKDKVVLADLEARPETGTTVGDFAQQLVQVLNTRVEWNDGLVVILAPTQVSDAVTWSAAVEALVAAPALSAVRWMMIDLESPTLGPWVEALGVAAMRTRCAVDAGAAQKEFGDMLDTMEAVPEGVSGPARMGAAWPKGVVPPSRVEYPVVTQAELEATLAQAGVAVPAAAKVGQTLGLKVLRASQAMRQRRDADAVRLQREARDLCLENGLIRDGVVMELILASFLVAMERRDEALSMYTQSIARADERSFVDLSAQGHMAMASLYALARRRDDAYNSYYLAAQKAQEADLKILAIEGWRMAGQIRFEAHDHEGAAKLWRHALAVVEEAPLPEAKASSAAEVATSLAALCRSQGLDAQARVLDAKAAELLVEKTPEVQL